MRIATWNVNSLRARIDRVEAFLQRHDVDVLALQELKGSLDRLPLARLETLGYEVAAHGLDQWNGVALLSRVGMDEVSVGFDGQPGFGKPGKDPKVEARAVGAVCGGVRVWSLYVPNGRDVDDPHYAYKLDWLARLREAARAWVDGPTTLMGDWNIAPTDADVWDLAEFAKQTTTHITVPERDAFEAFEAEGYTEVTRVFAPQAWTYWDYQGLGFQLDKGLRIDFALGSPAFRARVTGAFVDREERKGEGASDHAPVVVDLTD